MRNRYVLVLVALLFSILLSAKEEEFLVSISAVGMSMDYNEYVDDTLVDSERTLAGELISGAEISCAYLSLFDNEEYSSIALHLSYLSGNTEYVGSLLSSNSKYGSYIGSTFNTRLDVEAEYLYAKKLRPEIEILYGIGFGYQSWRRELSAVQVEVYHWYSLRPKIGIGSQHNDLYLGAMIEYQYGLSPEMDILANSENSDVTVNLGSGDILELSLPLKYTINEQIKLTFEYVYQYQVIDKSNSVPYIFNGSVEEIYEPDSKAYNQYLKFGAEFKF